MSIATYREIHIYTVAYYDSFGSCDLVCTVGVSKSDCNYFWS